MFLYQRRENIIAKEEKTKQKRFPLSSFLLFSGGGKSGTLARVNKLETGSESGKQCIWFFFFKRKHKAIWCDDNFYQTTSIWNVLSGSFLQKENLFSLTSSEYFLLLFQMLSNLFFFPYAARVRKYMLLVHSTKLKKHGGRSWVLGETSSCELYMYSVCVAYWFMNVSSARKRREIDRECTRH